MGALLLAPIQPPIASATTAVAKNNTLSVTSGSLIVFATGSQSFTNTGIAYSTIVGNGTVRTFHINNSGSLGVSRFTMTITLPAANSNVSAFRRCALNVSFTGTNTCATGSPVVVTDPVHNSATTYILTLPANSFYSFQIVQNKAGSLVVSVTTSLSNVSGTTTNS
jgi:hypothetical protein